MSTTGSIQLDGANSIVLAEGDGQTMTFTAGVDFTSDGVNLTATNANAEDLTISADGSVTLGGVNLNGATTDGDLVVTADSGDDSTGVLTLNGVVDQVTLATLSGGGTGTGATITVSTTATPMTKSNATILIKLVGSGYAVGDLITIPTTNSALNPGANIVITLTASDLMGSTGQGSLQFEISDSLQTNLILGILKYSGLIINDQMVMRAANGIEQQEEQNSKK